MPFEYSDVVNKVNKLTADQSDFCERMIKAFDDMKLEFQTLVANQSESSNNNNANVVPVNCEQSSTEQGMQHSLIGKTPASSKFYGTGERARLMGYIAEMMDLVQLPEDSDNVMLGKRDSVQDILDTLLTYAQAACSGMHKMVSKDTALDHTTLTWSKVPEVYKERAVEVFINMAKCDNIPFDRSEDHWAPRVMLARRYHNKYNPKRFEERQNKKGKTATREQRRVAGHVHPVSESSAIALKRARVDDASNTGVASGLLR